MCDYRRWVFDLETAIQVALEGLRTFGIQTRVARPTAMLAPSEKGPSKKGLLYPTLPKALK